MRVTLAGLNQLPEEQARAELRTCCASARWAAEVAARRPYPGLDPLLSVSDAVLAVLTWEDVLEALAALGELEPAPMAHDGLRHIDEGGA